MPVILLPVGFSLDSLEYHGHSIGLSLESTGTGTLSDVGSQHALHDWCFSTAHFTSGIMACCADKGPLLKCHRAINDEGFVSMFLKKEQCGREKSAFAGG